MSERRPFPPSARRLALARAAGLTAASPLLVGAIALVGAIVVLVGLGRAAAVQLGAWVASAARAADGAAATDGAADDGVGDLELSAADLGSLLHATDVARVVMELALPLLATAALAAFVVHVAQTRSLWIPRRRVPGAPTPARREGLRAMFDMACVAVVGVVAFGWLWLTAPQLAALTSSPSMAGLAVISAVVAFAIACVGLGVIDALLRRAQLVDALAMSREEKREDDRLGAADPRWRAQRLAVMRGPSVSDAVARAAIVIVGDDVAVAIEWDPTRQPVPLRSATGRRARATQLVGLARRHRVAVHRDAELAAVLVGGEGPVPDVHWARLAEIVAAVRRR